MRKQDYMAMKYLMLLAIFFTGVSLFGQDTVTETVKTEGDESQEKSDEKDDNKIKLDNIVITATRTEIDKQETGTSLTVITAEDLEKSGKINLVEVLTEVPGIAVNRNSVYGGQAGVYIRGSATGNTLVMIDGVEVNDPSHMSRAFDFSNLMLENIERIEILRGPQSTLYGSDATGGVINIITKRGKGDPEITLLFEAGSHKSFREGLSVSGSTEKSYYSFSASHMSSDGISKSAKAEGADKEPDDDAYRNITISSRLGTTVLEDSTIEFNFRYFDVETDLDEGAYADDPNYEYYSKNISGGVKFRQPLTEWWEHNIGISYMNQLRRTRNEVDEISSSMFNEWYEGNNRKGVWQHNFNIGKIDTLTMGFEIENEKGSFLSYADYGGGYGATVSNLDEKKVQTLSYYLQNHLKLFDILFVTLGGRVDDHKEFGTHASYKASVSYIVPVTETQIRGNLGTGFKAPSIYQLYDTIYGSRDLEPEKNKSYDAGVSQKLLDDMISFGITFFQSEYTNMLDFDSATYKYGNIGEVEIKGIEGEITVQPLEILKISYVQSYMKTLDKEKDDELYKRPRYHTSLNVNLIPIEKLNINLSALYMGGRTDKYYDPATWASEDKKLDAYIKFDLFASYSFIEYLQVYCKVENLANGEFKNLRKMEIPGDFAMPGKEYEESYGYAMPGITINCGIKATF